MTTSPEPPPAGRVEASTAPGSVDPAQVVAPVIRDLAARRLARSLWGLSALALLAILDAVLAIGPRPAALATLAGVVLAAASMLAQGMVAVRRASGDARQPWMVLAAASFAATHLFALWVFGYQGLYVLAREASGVPAATLSVAYLLASLRLMIDLGRVSAVSGLARVMSVPSPEEGGQR